MVNPLSLGWRLLYPTTATLEGGIWDFGRHLRSGKALVRGCSCTWDGVPRGQNRPLEKHPELWGSNKKAK